MKMRRKSKKQNEAFSAALMTFVIICIVMQWLLRVAEVKCVKITRDKTISY